MPTVVENMNLEVQLNSSLKVASQLNWVVKEVFGILVFISLGFEYRNWDKMLQLDKMLVRPHME